METNGVVDLHQYCEAKPRNFYTHNRFRLNEIAMINGFILKPLLDTIINLSIWFHGYIHFHLYGHVNLNENPNRVRATLHAQ
jgi:hypothetical protein